MVSFYICDSLDQYTKATKQDDALYFVKGYGIFKGSVLCTEYNTNVLSALIEEVRTLADIVDTKAAQASLDTTNTNVSNLTTRVTTAETNIGKKVDATAYNTKVQALDQKDIALQNDIEKKLNIANPAATGTFTLADSAGHNASFVYDGSALTITLS